MASRLEDTTVKARKLSVGCIIAVVVIAVVSLLIKLLEPAPERPDLYPTIAQTKFGSIEKLEIPSLELLGTNPTYTMDTSKIPYTYLNVLNVYKTQQPRQSLTAQEDAENIARTLGFNTQPLLVTESLLQWKEGARTLEIDKYYWTIKLTTNYLSNEVLDKDFSYTPNLSNYTVNASDVIRSIGETVYTKTKANFMRIDANGELVTAQSSQEADLVRVDFFDSKEAIPLLIPTTPELTEEELKTYEQYRIFGDILPENPNQGLIYVVIGQSKSSTIVYELQVINWRLSDSSTYQVININEAKNKVLEGKGSLVSLTQTDNDLYREYTPLDIEEFLINSISIGFNNSKEYTQYLQPVYVFKGKALLTNSNAEADFTILYPAIYSEETTTVPE